MRLHESAYIIYMQGPWICHERHATPYPVLSVLSVMSHVSCLAGHEADKKKKPTKHAREPLSLTLSPCALHILLLRTPCSVLYIDIHVLHTGTACAAYTAWCGMASVRGECLRLVSENG